MAAVQKVVNLIRVNEYKRRQRPRRPTSRRAGFGKDWRYPITSGYRPRAPFSAQRTFFRSIARRSNSEKNEAIVKPFKLDEVREALSEIGVTGSPSRK
jgi:hypothetical protein